MINLEFGILHPVQQHVHARQVIGGDVLLLPDNFTNAVRAEPMTHIEQQRAGAAGKIKHALQVLAELRAVAFVEDEDHALLAQRFQSGQIVVFVATVQRQAELLDGGDDHFVGVVVGKQAAHQGFGIGVFFDTLFLKLVKFLPRLSIQVFAIHHEQAFIDIRVVLEQDRCFERSERFSTAGGVPDVAVAAVLVDALDDGLDGIDLIRAHHQQFLLAGHSTM